MAFAGMIIGCAHAPLTMRDGALLAWMALCSRLMRGCTAAPLAMALEWRLHRVLDHVWWAGEPFNSACQA